jgi:hypothetical protein
MCYICRTLLLLGLIYFYYYFVEQTIVEAVGDWYSGRRQGVKYIDCHYPCNPTCSSLLPQRWFFLTWPPWDLVDIYYVKIQEKKGDNTNNHHIVLPIKLKNNDYLECKYVWPNDWQFDWVKMFIEWIQAQNHHEKIFPLEELFYLFIEHCFWFRTHSLFCVDKKKHNPSAPNEWSTCKDNLQNCNSTEIKFLNG